MSTFLVSKIAKCPFAHFLTFLVAKIAKCPLAHFLMSRRVILLQEILETFLCIYLVVCGLFCNFAVAMRG